MVLLLSLERLLSGCCQVDKNRLFSCEEGAPLWPNKRNDEPTVSYLGQISVTNMELLLCC